MLRSCPLNSFPNLQGNGQQQGAAKVTWKVSLIQRAAVRKKGGSLQKPLCRLPADVTQLALPQMAAFLVNLTVFSMHKVLKYN